MANKIPMQRVIQAGWDGLQGDGYLAAAREALALALEQRTTLLDRDGPIDVVTTPTLRELLDQLTPKETPDGLDKSDSDHRPAAAVVGVGSVVDLQAQVTPDAALLEEAGKLISALHPGSGRGTVSRLIAALRAALDREREMRGWLEIRERSEAAAAVMIDGLIKQSEQAERERDDYRDRLADLRAEFDHRTESLATELQRLKEGKP